MSTFEIKMPKLGESITEGTIVTWFKQVGDVVEEDDNLFEVTTAKVNAEVPSPMSGVLSKIFFEVDATVPVGETVALLQLEAEETEETDEVSKPETQPASEAPTPQPAPETKPSPPIQKSDRWYSPVVLKLAKSAGLNSDQLDQIPGSGFEGRLTKKDLQNHLQNRKPLKPAAPAAPATPATPATPAPMPQTPASTASPTSVESDANVEVKEMDLVRRIIADRMVQSKKISAHVTTIVEVDVTKLVQWHKRYKADFQAREGIRLSFLPMIVEATARALKDYPTLNASIQGHQVLLKKNINMGIAVSLDDGNLVVPVLHHADRLSITGIAQGIDDLATRARSNKLKTRDVEGGTFTITNFGTFRNIIGTPIINQPEVAILGVGYIEKKPAVVETPEGDVIAIRSKMYLSLSYDHRLIDGSLGGAFVKRIADYLENWNTNQTL